MPTGPKPKPKAVAKRDGTRKDRINENEPEPERGRPKMPKHIKGLEYGSQAWEWICDELDAMHVLSLADALIIETTCMTYQALMESHLLCMTKGREVIGYNEDGEEVKYTRAPWDIAYRDYAGQMSTALGNLGLSPTSRTRLSVPTTGKKDPSKLENKRKPVLFNPNQKIG